MRAWIRAFGAAALLATAAAGPVAAGGDVGVRPLTVTPPERSEAVRLSLWYPAAGDGEPVRVGENGVFRGTPARRSATVEGGPFPLVLIAHGGFRSAPDSAGWLGAALAREGYVVAEVTPPPVPAGPARQSVLAELWLRPADLSAALTAVLADPVAGPAVDPARTGVVGFFLGGHSALAVAGARVDPEAFRQNCAGAAASGIDCAWFAAGAVDLRKVDGPALSRDNRDGRIAAAVAVAPEFSGSFSPESLQSIPVPVTLVALGPRESRPDADLLDSALPGADRLELTDASTFSAFDQCKPKGAAILREEDAEPLCDDPPGRARAEIHAALAATIASALRRAFSLP